MNWKSTAIVVFALGAFLATPTGVLAGEAMTQEVDRSEVCMMQDAVQTKAGIPHEYQGKTYYLCCPMCVDTFDDAPDRYSRAHDPVSGQEVDKATAPVLGYRGRAYFFASEESRAAFAKDPDRYLKAMDH